MFDEYEKAYLIDLVQRELENIKGGYTSYGTKQDNMEAFEDLTLIFKKLKNN